jgi:phosphotransferase family enzyme
VTAARPTTERHGRGLSRLRSPRLELPLLRQALDVGVMDPKLCALVDADGSSRPRLTSARLLTGKLGSRALIAYRLEWQDGRTVRLLAKHFADPLQARIVHETACQLRSAARGWSFAIPRLLGWLQELSTVVYVPVPGRPFGDVAFQRGGGEYVQPVARALAQLHASRLSLDRRFDLEQELRNLRIWAEFVARAQPESAATARRLAVDLARAGTGMNVSLDAPVHKDFHYQHVIVRGLTVAILDLDEVRFGDPTFDLAHFCSYLELLAARNGSPSASGAVVRSFLDTYAQKSGWVKDVRFDYFSAYTWLKIAKQLATARGPTPRPAGSERKQQLALALRRGSALARAL